MYGGKGTSELVGYVDSDFAGDQDSRKSTTGYVFLLSGIAVSWGSKKQQPVATSTVETEYIAASQAIKEGIWLGSLLSELGVEVETVKLFCDNMGCITNLENHVLSKYTKHISVCYHHAREKVAWGQVSRLYVPIEYNLVDLLTKPLTNTLLVSHKQSMGVGRIE